MGRIVAKRATIDLREVEAFVKVVEAQSFTAAARLLGVPKSSVSRAVTRLEDELGTTLLTRTTRKLALTDHGQRYLQSARDALQILTEARDSLADDGAEPRGTVRITAAPDPSGRLLAEPLAEFTKRYPLIHVDVLFTSRRVDLIEEGVDLALRAGKLDDATLVGRKIGTSAHILVAAPGYLAQRGTPRRLHDLTRHACLLYRAARGRQRWTFTRMGRTPRTESVEVGGPISADELSILVQLVKRGAGIALLPQLACEEALQAGELVRVLPAYQQQGNALYLVHPASRRLPRRVAVLSDFLYEAIRARFAQCMGKVSTRP